MGNGLAIGHLCFSALGVHVDPLVIPGRFGELVDPVLINDHPIGQADLDALQHLRIFDGTDYVQLVYPDDSSR